MQGTWYRIIALSLIAYGCNPLYYSDLTFGNAKRWEFYVWNESRKPFEKNQCAEKSRSMEQPKTIAIKPMFGMYDKDSDVVTYPLGEIEVLYHEYVHARSSVLDDKCLSEVMANLATKDWLAKRRKTLRKDS